MYKEIIQQKLKNAREDIGLTQREIADRIEEPQSKIAKIESGTQSPDVEIIGKLAELYEVSLDWLFGVGPKKRQ